VEIRPLLLTPVVAELARGQKTSWLAFTHDCCATMSVSDGWKGVVAVFLARNVGSVAV